MTRWPHLLALELFVAVVEDGSVGAAARRVAIAQPNASRLLADLERATGSALLNRGPRGSTPTAQGLLLADQARAVLTAATQFNQWLDLHDGDVELRVGASMTIAESLLPAWLSRFHQQHPRVRVDLKVLNSVQVIEGIHTGALQLGFVESPNPPSHLHTRTVHEDELVVVIGPTHPWADRQEPLTIAELAHTHLVVREAGSGTRETLDELLADLDQVPPAQVLYSNAAVRVAVAASGGAPAALSRLTVRNHLASGELLAVPLQRRVHRPLTATWHGPRRLNSPAADLLAIARQ